MMWRNTSVAVRVVIPIVFTAVLSARDIVVLVDVSGSVKHYSESHADAPGAISALVNGAPLPSSWRLTGAETALQQYRLADQDRARLIEFGTVDPAADFPFFRAVSGPLTREGLGTAIPVDSGRFTQGKTNSALAQAVAARLLAESSNDAGAVIMVSDFLQDADLSPKQLAFVNEMQLRYGIQTLATVSWLGNPQFQIKLLKLVPVSLPTGSSPGQATDADLGRLRLGPVRPDKAKHTVSLTWSYEGTASPTKFDLAIRDARSTVVSKSGLAGTSVTVQLAKPGQFTWSVLAHLQGGSTIQQAASFVLPDDGGGGLGVLILVAGILAMAVFAAVLIRRYGLPDALAGLKKRKPYSEI